MFSTGHVHAVVSAVLMFSNYGASSSSSAELLKKSSLQASVLRQAFHRALHRALCLSIDPFAEPFTEPSTGGEEVEGLELFLLLQTTCAGISIFAKI